MPSAKERLVKALTEAGAPQAMIADAAQGGYDDFESNRAMPITELVHDCKRAGLNDLARRAMNGEFDAP